MSAPHKSPGFALTHDLSGRVALVTGASSGLGDRFARVLAAAGAKVAVVARRGDRLANLVTEIEAAGGTAFALTTDVGNTAGLTKMFDDIEGAFGMVDILVNNAGVNADKWAVDITPDDFDTVMNVNVRACYFLATEMARRLIAAKRPGNIINLASVRSIHVQPQLSLYNISKAAIHMMTRCHAREWARYGISVNAMAPGYIETEMTRDWFATELGQKQIRGWPRRRLQEIESLDAVLLLLASAQGGGMCGSVVQVDDGQFI